MNTMADESEIEDCVRRAQAGDARATEELLRHFRPRIFRYCYARLGDREVAEDVTQESCLALSSALPSYEQRGVPFAGFVFGIASNKIAMARRSRARRPEDTFEQIAERVAKGPGPAETIENTDTLRGLLAHLDVLPERQRHIVLMRVVAGLSTDETAAVLGMSTGNVRVAQHRALTALRQRLTALGAHQ